MADNRMVYHDGEVIGTRGNHIQVKIVSKSACADCHAKSMCTASDMKEKIIDAVSNEPLYKGDLVSVIMQEKLGWLALLYGFGLPFLVLITVLFTLYGLGHPETHAALYALGSLGPYYLVLYMFKDKIEKDFVFTAEKKE